MRWDTKADSIYRYCDGKLRPEFTVDFGSDVPLHSYYPTPGFYSFEVYSEPKEVAENSWVVMPKMPFIIDRTTLRGGNVKLQLDVAGTLTIKSGWLYCKTPQYFAYCIEPGTLSDMLQEAIDSGSASPSELDTMQKLLDSINPDDNCYLFFGRWKQLTH